MTIRSRALAATGLTALLLSAAFLSGCSSPDGSSGDESGTGSGSGSAESSAPADAASAAPDDGEVVVPDVTIAPCPAALIDSYVADGGTVVDYSVIPQLAVADIQLAPSCAIQNVDLANTPYWSTFYITEQTDEVIGYYNDAYAAAGVRSQVADSTEDGTWDLGDAGTVSATLGTAEGDAHDDALIDGSFIWSFIASAD